MGLGQTSTCFVACIPQLLLDDLPPHYLLRHQGKTSIIYILVLLDGIQLETTEPTLVPPLLCQLVSDPCPS